MGIQTILTNDKIHFFESHCHNHGHQEPEFTFPNVNYLDVTDLIFGNIGTFVRCSTAVAAKINLYVRINEDSIPVSIIPYDQILGICYEKVENGILYKVIAPVKEVDDKLVKQLETIELEVAQLN